MPDLSNIPGFTELAGAGDFTNFPTEADSWNAPGDATSKRTTNPAFTVSGVDVVLDRGQSNTPHVMRGQGGIKGNNKIIALSYMSSNAAYSGLGNAYQWGFQAHVFTINTSTGALTCSTTNKQNITGSNSVTSNQYPNGTWYDACGSGFLMGALDYPLNPSSNSKQLVVAMQQFNSTFSNVSTVLSYDSQTSGGGIHDHSSGRISPSHASICVPLTSTDSEGGEGFFRNATSSDSIERAYPNGAEVSFSANSGIWRSGYARYSYGYGTFIQPDAPLCGANDFHSIIGGYGSTNNYYRCIQSSGDGSYYDTGQSSSNDVMYAGQNAMGFQRSGSTHTIYLVNSSGSRAGETVPMTAYNSSYVSASSTPAKSWRLPRYGQQQIGHSCVGIGSNKWISNSQEGGNFFSYYNQQQNSFPVIEWELDDTNGVTITGAVNCPKIDFGKGYPVNMGGIDASVSQRQWAFPIWTNANDTDPSWLVVVFYSPGGSYGGGTQPIVKSYPWPTFKSLNIALG